MERWKDELVCPYCGLTQGCRITSTGTGYNNSLKTESFCDHCRRKFNVEILPTYHTWKIEQKKHTN